MAQMTEVRAGQVAQDTPRERPKRKKGARMPAPLIVVAIGFIVTALLVASLTGSDDGVPVAVAARTIAVGESLNPGDFRYVNAELPDELLGRSLRRADVASISGNVAKHTIEAGALVGRDDVAVAAGPQRQRAVSIPIDAERAVGGRLKPGDVVDVADATSGVAVYVVTDAEVISVGVDTGGKAMTSSSRYAVTLGVDDTEALRLGPAFLSDKVYLVRSTGAPPALPAPPTTLVTRRP